MPVLNLDTPVGRVYQPGDAMGLAEDDRVMQQGQLGPEEFFGGEEQGISEETLNNLSRYIQDLHRAYDGSSTRHKMLQLIADSRRAYYTEIEETDFPWDNASNMITPLTTMGVDEVEPRLAAAVIGREPYISVKPSKVLGQEPMVARQMAQAVEDFDNWILEHKVKVKELVPEMIHEYLLDGTIYPLLSWEEEIKAVRRSVIQPGPDGQPAVQKIETQVRRGGPKVHLVPVDFVWHADDIDDEDAWEKETVIRYVGEYTVGELKKLAANDPSWILPEDLNKYQTAMKYYKTVQQEKEEVTDYGWVYAPNQRPIEFYEAYLQYPLYGEEDTKIIVLVELNSFKVFRIREQIETNDENIKPLRRMRFMRRKGVSWGYPLYSLIAGIQLGMDAMWNRCVNSADITMTPWGFIKRGATGLRDNKAQTYPGNLIELDNPENVNFPNLSAFQPTQFVPLIMQYVSFFERTLNVSDFIQGRESQISGKKGTTATGTLAVLQEGKIKFEYRGGLTHNEFLRFFKDIHDLCVSHMPLEDMTKICGQPIMNYSSTEDFNFILSGSDLISNRFVERQETESFLATMGPFMELINPMAPLFDLLSSYKKDPQDYIDPELMQLVAHYLEVKRNAKAIAAMGVPPEVAKELAQQGATPETVAAFAKKMGHEAGKAMFQPEEEEESGTDKQSTK